MIEGQKIMSFSSYSFDNFVVGPNNRFAYAVATAIAGEPGTNYNPFFLYSAVGLGKTHLTKAIANQILKEDPSKQVYHLSSEAFTSELISSLKENKVEDFRSKYRQGDVLILDDIQFMVGKERTQEEFFHTFNTLYDTNKQIILTSDVAPQELNGLEERLVSRFESGISTSIASPDFEVRVAILRQKAESYHYDVPGNVLEYIAKNFGANVRELEGALIRVIAYNSATNEEITYGLAQEALKQNVSFRHRFIGIEDIQKVISKHFDISLSDMKSRKRRKALVLPRQIAMYLTRDLTQHSYEEIGENFGGKDHSTVMHACRRIKKMIIEDDMLSNLLDKFRQELTSY